MQRLVGTFCPSPHISHLYRVYDSYGVSVTLNQLSTEGSLHIRLGDFISKTATNECQGPAVEGGRQQVHKTRSSASGPDMCCCGQLRTDFAYETQVCRDDGRLQTVSVCCWGVCYSWC